MCSNDQRYNLLDEKWLPVLTLRGKNEKLGIIETLEQAASIRQIAPSNPMDRFAVFRFLLAVCYWCADRTKMPFSKNGSKIPSEWIIFLERRRDCFNLLGDGKRFYQSKNGHEQSITYLIHELPSGTNHEFIRHVCDDRSGLCPACCALGLIRLPVFTTSGGRGYSPGINGTPPLYMISWGYNLYELLRANWRISDSIGPPSWDPGIQASISSEDIPLLAGLTSLPRYVWLKEPDRDENTGICSFCGIRTDKLISHCEYSPVAGVFSESWKDPYIIDISTSSKRKSLMVYNLKSPGKFTFDRRTNEQLPMTPSCNKMLLIGFCADKAENVDVWEKTITLSSSSSEEEMGSVWNIAAREITKKVKAPFILQKARPHVEQLVANHMTDLLSGNGNYTWDDAANEYAPFMEAAAESLTPDVTIRDARKRREITQVRPKLPKEDK